MTVSLAFLFCQNSTFTACRFWLPHLQTQKDNLGLDKRNDLSGIKVLFFKNLTVS